MEKEEVEYPELIAALHAMHTQRDNIPSTCLDDLRTVYEVLFLVNNELARIKEAVREMAKLDAMMRK